VEGHPWWSLARDGKYEGPFWNVLALHDPHTLANRDPARDHSVPRERWENESQWVARYELSVRSDGERGWRCLGTFRGNEDATSEVAHSLRALGVSARYLRFHPIEGVGGGAMRVGIYGSAVAANLEDGGAPRVQKALRGSGRRRGGGGGEDGGGGEGADGPPVVTYVIGEALGPKASCDHSIKRGRWLSKGCPCCRRREDFPARRARREGLLRAAGVRDHDAALFKPVAAAAAHYPLSDRSGAGGPTCS